MSNRRFEMYEYRQIISRMRLGETDRAISRAGLLGRKKATAVREIALDKGWLDPKTPLPDDATLAAVFAKKSEPSVQSSLVLPYAHDVEQWYEAGIQQKGRKFTLPSHPAL